MKKILLIFLVVTLLSISLLACNNKVEYETETLDMEILKFEYDRFANILETEETSDFLWELNEYSYISVFVDPVSSEETRKNNYIAKENVENDPKQVANDLALYFKEYHGWFKADRKGETKKINVSGLYTYATSIIGYLEEGRDKYRVDFYEFSVDGRRGTITFLSEITGYKRNVKIFKAFLDSIMVNSEYSQP